MKWLPLIGWAVGTFWLHCAIHEGAHALVANKLGWHVTGVRLYPHWNRWGHFVWAETLFLMPQNRPAQTLAVSAAPAVAELAWMVLALGAGLWWPPAALEAIPAAVDFANWCRGLVTRQPEADAARVLEALR